MPENDDTSYEIGFSKPPKKNQFRKGVSGNLKGRPKGVRNLATVLERTLREKVVINENGLRKTITKLEAAVKQLVNQAASGDLVAMRQLSALTAAVEGRNPTSETTELANSDHKVVESILKRLESSTNEEKR